MNAYDPTVARRMFRQHLIAARRCEAEGNTVRAENLRRIAWLWAERIPRTEADRFFARAVASNAAIAAAEAEAERSGRI